MPDPPWKWRFLYLGESFDNPDCAGFAHSRALSGTYLPGTYLLALLGA